MTRLAGQPLVPLALMLMVSPIACIGGAVGTSVYAAAAAAAAASVELTINNTWSPSAISTLISSQPAGQSLDLLLQLVAVETTDDGDPRAMAFFHQAQLQAMLPDIAGTVIRLRGSTGGELVPIRCNGSSAPVVALGTSRPAFQHLALADCHLNFTAYNANTANDSSPPFMTGVLMTNSTVCLRPTFLNSFELLLSGVTFNSLLRGSAMETDVTTAALLLDFSEPRRAAPADPLAISNESLTAKVTVQSCSYTGLVGVTPIAIVDWAQPGAGNQAAVVLVHVEVEVINTRFTNNTLSGEHPNSATALLARLGASDGEDRAAVSSYNITLSNCTVEKCSAEEQAAIDVLVTGGNHTRVELNIRDSTYLQHNRMVPIRVNGIASLRMARAYVLDNTVQTRVTFDPALTFSAGLALVAQTTVSMVVDDDCQFQRNTLIANESSQVHSSGGAMLLLLDGCQHSDILISSSVFEHNRVKPTVDQRMRTATTYHGGAVAAFLQSGAADNRLAFVDCRFHNNCGMRGGALAVYHGQAVGNSVDVTCSRLDSLLCGFRGNNATGVSDDRALENDDRLGAGGGLSVSFNTGSHGNNVTVRNQSFDGNGAADGGGMHVEFRGNEAANTLNVTACNYSSNTAIIGAGLSLWGMQGLGGYKRGSSEPPSTIVTYSLVFVENKPFFTGAMAVVDVRFRMLGHFQFHRNSNSALYLRNTICDFSCRADYINNTAHGAAGVFSVSSVTVLYENAEAHFYNNVALSTAGGMFAYSDFQTIESASGTANRQCFLAYHNDSVDAQNWAVNINFTGNVAGLSGSAIYANTIQPCGWLVGKLACDVNKLPWLTLNDRHNYIVPELYRGVQGRSVYTASPGGSLQLLALPKTYFWRQVYIQNINTSTNYSQVADTNQRCAATSTDIVVLYILDDETHETMSKLPRRDRCPFANRLYGDIGTPSQSDTIVRVSPGMEHTFYAIACDAFGNSVDAMLFVTTSERSTCPELTEGIATDGCQAHSNNAHHYTAAGIAAEEVEEAKLSDAIIESSNVPLHACGQTSDPVVFYRRTQERPSVSTQFTASVVGSSNLVSRTFAVQFAGCPAGYTWDSSSNKDCKYGCVCIRDFPSEESNREQVRGCRGNHILLSRGYWATSKLKRLNDSLGGMAIDIHPCPLGYCACPRYGNNSDNCVFDTTSSPSSSCADNRTGTLCGECPSGTVGVLTFFGAKCLSASSCGSWKSSVLLFMGIALVVVLLLVWLEVSLTGDIRALVFYFSVLPMLFMENDSFMQSLSKAESGYQVVLRNALRSAAFHVPANCWIAPAETLDGIATGFIAPATLLLAIAIVFLLTLCRCKFDTNIFNGMFLVFLVAFQWFLVPAVMLLRRISISTVDSQHKAYVYYYDARYVFGTWRSGILDYLSISIICLLSCFLVMIFVLSLGKLPKKWLAQDAKSMYTALTIGLGGTASDVNENQNGNYSDGNSSRSGAVAMDNGWMERMRRWIDNGGMERVRRRLGKLLFVWDLLRRCLLVTATMAIHSLWYKQSAIRLLCLVFLVVQVAVSPYSNLDRLDIADEAVRGNMLPCFRRGVLCNGMETFVLACMFAVSWLSVDTSETDHVYNDKHRANLINVFIGVPLWMFVALVLIKLGLLFYRKSVRCAAKSARDVAMAPGSVQGRGERQRLLPGGPGRRRRQRGASNEDGGRRCSIQ